MKSTSSLNEKKEIIETIKGDNFIENALYYTYNPFLKYYVTSKNCKKNSGLFKYNMYTNPFDLLDALVNREYTGHDAIALVNGFVTANNEYADLIYNILDRNLDIRASEAVINKVIPNAIAIIVSSIFGVNSSRKPLEIQPIAVRAKTISTLNSSCENLPNNLI